MSTNEALRWGIPVVDEVSDLGARLSDFYDRFRRHVHTQTRDTGEYGLDYVSGLLRMETKRNMANIGRKTETSGQNLHHFISNSPWSGPDLIHAVQDEIKNHSDFENAILVLDESAEEKAGPHSAGTGRQHNGRLGKIEMSQVGVFLSLVTSQVNTWIDGELYIPAHWFEPDQAAKRIEVGLPERLTFKTKPEIGWQMVQGVQARDILFEAVVMDDLYGRNTVLRRRLHDAGVEYYGDIPKDTQVYLEKPKITYPLTKWGKRSKNTRIEGEPEQVQVLHSHLDWQTLRLRPNERGYLQADFGCCRVW